MFEYVLHPLLGGIWSPKYQDHVTIITILMNSVDFMTTNEIWNKLIFLSWYLLHTHSVLTHKAWRHWLLLYPPAAQPQTTRQDAQQVVKLGWRCRSYFCGEVWVGPSFLPLFKFIKAKMQDVLIWNWNIFTSTYEDNAIMHPLVTSDATEDDNDWPKIILPYYLQLPLKTYLQTFLKLSLKICLKAFFIDQHDDN